MSVVFRSSAVVAIVGARIFTGLGNEIESGTVVFSGGKIQAVGRAGDVKVPAGASQIDGRGKTLLPGFIDVATALGLVEISLSPPENDAHEKSAKLTPQVRALDGLFFDSRAIPVAREGGVTSVVAQPVGNVIAGTSVLYRVSGGIASEVVIAADAALHFKLGEQARGGDKPPQTRMGVVAAIRQQLEKARGYQQKLDAYTKEYEAWKSGARAGVAGAASATTEAEKKEPVPPPRNLGLQAIARVLAGRTLAIFHADRMSDILVALRIIREFKLRAAIADGAEAWRVAREIARDKVPVIVAPVRVSPSRMETLECRLSNAAVLHAAGVEVVIGSNDVFNVRNLRYEAGFAAAHGLPRSAALRAITNAPARLFGVDAQIGSISVGRDADLVLWAGDPIDTDGRIVHMWVAGKLQSPTR
ncbi:MAG: amidohydrolase family protein [Deltaproteobacteria bacterium]|nr:amidohydrolase family protein [Deltaproteobacteria bacterium]